MEVKIKQEYIDRERRKQELGYRGEIYVLEQERKRLAAYPELARRVEQVSQTRGDDLGYDILSFNEDGSERYIEVKTTNYSSQTPFFISENELQFSRKHASHYYLYRLFNFDTTRDMYQVRGNLENICHMVTTGYKAQFLKY